MGKRMTYIAPLATVNYFPLEEEDPLSAGSCLGSPTHASGKGSQSSYLAHFNDTDSQMPPQTLWIRGWEGRRGQV